MIKQLIKNRIFKASLWYLITEFFTKGLAFVSIPIFTRLLSTHDYGVISVYGAWVATLQIIISLNVTSSLRVAKNDFKNDFDGYASSMICLSLVLLIAVLLLVITFIDFFSKLTDFEHILVYLLIVNSYTSFVLNFINTKLRFEYKYIAVSIITILTKVFSVILGIFFILKVFTEKGYFGKILGQVIPLFIVGIIFIFFILRKGKLKFNLKYLKYALGFSIPLIPHNLSHIINNQFDRIMINKFLGFSEAGIYSFSYNVGMIVIVIFFALNKAWEPWFFEKYNKKEIDTILEKSKILRNLFFLLYSLMLLFLPELVKILADKSYWEGLFIIPIIFASYYLQFLYTFELFIEFGNKKTLFVSVGTLMSAAINVFLNILFIPRFGYVAAAYTTLISYLSLFVFHYLFTHFLIKASFYPFRFHLNALLKLMIITILYYLISDYLMIRFSLSFVLILLTYITIKKQMNY